MLPKRMHAEEDVSAAEGCRYSVYLLYWYKSTNTDAERAAVKGFAGKLRKLQMQIQIRYQAGVQA